MNQLHVYISAVKIVLTVIGAKMENLATENEGKGDMIEQNPLYRNRLKTFFQTYFKIK